LYTALRGRALAGVLTWGRVNKTAGMKLKKRIGNPALTAADYKNTAFLRVMLPYLDGISDLNTNFRFLSLNFDVGGISS
jgi:hypothetical protein